jgi:hypothetical protein
MTAPTLDFWFDFGSTYSYPAAMRIVPLAGKAGVTVNFRPFLLGPIFKAQGWNTSPFIFSRPRAATCGATSSGFAPIWRFPSNARSHFRNPASWRRTLRWWASAIRGETIFALRYSVLNSPADGASMSLKQFATFFRT